MSWLPKAYRHVTADPDCLAIGGLVERPHSALRFDDFDRMPAAFQVEDVGAYASFARVNGEPIRGVRFSGLLEASEALPEAMYVIARTHAGYSASVWRREIERLAIVAFARGDEPLPSGLGGPFRLLLPGFRDESRDLYDLATIEFSKRRASDSRNRRARVPRPPSQPGDVQGGLVRAVVDPAEPRSLISPPP